MIYDLVPAQVASADMRGYDPSVCLLPEEADMCIGMVESRVREFTCGRTCARRALLRLGLPASPIRRGSRREPLWPSGVVGSITHCVGYCAAVVANQIDILTIGIDAEIHAPLPSGILEEVALDQERAWLATAPGSFCWDVLLFSAKEAVYKAWFPLTGTWLGFEDVVVTFAPTNGTFHAQLGSTALLSTTRCNLNSFSGRFVVRDGLALTAITMPRC